MTDELDEALSAEVLAYQAKELSWFLAHEGYQRAVEATETRITKEWIKADNPLSREMAWHKLQAFRALQQELRAVSTRKPQLVEG
jgi:hypothetical protein